jgi:hypothetical protein
MVTERQGPGQDIGALVHTVASTHAIRAREARRWRIGLAAEIDAHDIALARNHIAINCAQHGNAPSDIMADASASTVTISTCCFLLLS